MLLKQLVYFQAVVENHSFSEAAEVCHISQSAISQQIKALEEDLGVPLLVRHNRTFSLTPQGEHFYQKSLVILTDLERLKKETAQIGRRSDESLSLGYLKGYGGSEFQDAVAAFSEQYPNVQLHVVSGNHEDLYNLLIHGEIDLAFNDQRRAFSDGYMNVELVKKACMIEVAAHNPLARLGSIEAQDLKNATCVLVAGADQQENERAYYRDIIGFHGDFLFAETLSEARILVVSGRGFLPVEGVPEDAHRDRSISRIPLVRGSRPVLRNYCVFWNQNNSGYYVEAFADLLKAQFDQEKPE